MFLTSSGIVKLGDFGIARRMDSSIDFAKTQIGAGGGGGAGGAPTQSRDASRTDRHRA